MNDLAVIGFVTLIVMLACMRFIELAFDCYTIRKIPSDSFIETRWTRMKLRRISYWWAWQKADFRRKRWLRKHLYPPKFHLEYQALLLVCIGAHELYIESLDPDPEERLRLGMRHQKLLDEFVEKNCPPFDPATIE